MVNLIGILYIKYTPSEITIKKKLLYYKCWNRGTVHDDIKGVENLFSQGQIKQYTTRGEHGSPQ